MFKKLVVVSKNEMNPQYRWLSTSFFHRLPLDMWYKVTDLEPYESHFWIKSKDLEEVRDKAAPDFEIYTAREWRAKQRNK